MRTDRQSTNPLGMIWRYEYSGVGGETVATATAANGTYVVVVGRAVSSGVDGDQFVHIWAL